jgi:hypothetical protein
MVGSAVQARQSTGSLLPRRGHRTKPRLKCKHLKHSLHKPTEQANVRFNAKTIYLGMYNARETWEAHSEFIARLPKPGGRVFSRLNSFNCDVSNAFDTPEAVSLNGLFQ